jgi:histone H3/H4
MTTILDDAKMVSGHAKKKVIDNDDIKLAVQVKQKFVKTIFCVSAFCTS